MQIMKSINILIPRLILLAVCISERWTAQRNLDNQEQKITAVYARLQRNGQDGKADSTLYYTRLFTRNFSKLIKDHPMTMKYPFDMIKEKNYLQIATSGDGNLRLYSWDTWTGGSMHRYSTLYQWRSGSKVMSKLSDAVNEKDPGSFVSDIHSLRHNNKTYYLVITNAVFSGRDARQSITAYTINKGTLIPAAGFFVTGNKQSDKIDLDFDFFSVIDRPERPLKLINFNTEKQVLNIPITDKDDRITNHYKQYTFKDGRLRLKVLARKH